MYDVLLNEMIGLLEKSGNTHWVNWFKKAEALYKEENLSKSYKKVLGAYGGVGSFNDVFWALPEKDFDRLEYLKGKVWQEARRCSRDCR